LRLRPSADAIFVAGLCFDEKFENLGLHESGQGVE